MNGESDTARRSDDRPVRLRVAIRGAVQGVGFRPFVYRLATELGLAGWVLNSAQGVFVEVDGLRPTLENFLTRLSTEKPPLSFIQSFEATWLDAAGFHGFEIRHSEREGAVTALVLPDIATCPDCLADIFDPQNRRYLYPFTNCTNCGPRYSIIEALPYDRPNTSMKNFAMCPDCRREYEDPADRRFHAQPNACSVCGPRLALWDADGAILATEHDALLRAADLLRRGGILAMKGIGGFHLLADARNESAINTLRARKHRDEKPLAVMVPDLAAARALCEVSALEERLLASPEAPIVLLQRRDAETRGRGDAEARGHGDAETRGHGDAEAGNASRLRAISPSPSPSPFTFSPSSLAPNNPTLGLMLPYSPMHHILLRELGFPVVATSGNLSDEPICTDEREALQRLHGIADAFLVHDRPIVRHVDDSVLRVMAGREMLLRRARGFAPLPLPLPDSTRVVIALGAHLKNSVALASGGNAFISQHIGDLETREAHEAFTRVCSDLQQLFDAKAEHAVCDLHPDYLSTAHAEKHFASVTRVQHHHAHVASCMADNDLRGPVLGVAWDGTGYGPDGTAWGGEFLLVDDDGYERFASLRPFRLPGGDIAAKEPRRSALGLLYEMHGDAIFDRGDLAPLRAFDADELLLLQRMLVSGYNAPYTSSTGRLFDAVSSLLDLRQVSAFEGQAAMVLEFSTAERDVQTRGHGDAGTRARDDAGTRGHGDAGTRARDDAGTRGHGDAGTRARDDAGTRGHGDAGTRARDDAGTRGHGDAGTQGRPPEYTAGERSQGSESTYAFSINDLTSLRLHDSRPHDSHPHDSRLHDSRFTIDWAPVIDAIIADVARGVPVPRIAQYFHAALAEAIVAVARLAGRERVVLSGGCFQNTLLTERAIERLTAEGFRPYWHQRVPPNDGGIALGQLWAALKKE